MNTELIAGPNVTGPNVTGPDVTAFVGAVRAHLRDLPVEDQQDLTEGLEADMVDKVAEQGRGVLDDPDGYARELRVAAGFSPDPAPVTQRGSISESINGLFDAAHTRWNSLVTGLPGDPWSFVQSLRPAWWVLRAWVTLQLADIVLGADMGYGLSPLPSLGALSWPLLIAATVFSVQIGRGKLWPGRAGAGVLGRVLLVGLNILAIGLVPLIFDQLAVGDQSMAGGDRNVYQEGFFDGQSAKVERDSTGIYADGKRVSQIYPYDAAGKPLVGVQLFDQQGSPLNLKTQTECVYGADGAWLTDHGRVYYPWTNGAAQQKNVIPVPSVLAGPEVSDPDPQAFAREVKPTIGQFPFASVPPISLPGLAVSTATTPAAAYQPGVKPKTLINGVDQGC